MPDQPTRSPLADEHVDAPVRDSDRVYTGAVWTVQRERFALGDVELTRDFVRHTGAVAVFALDEDDRVLLIRQYRHPVRAREWEVPAGLLDVPGEDPLAAAKRELAEEADHTAGTWHVLSDYLSSPGGSDEALRVYVARDLAPTAHAFERTAEEAEIEVAWVDLDEVVDAVLARRVHNPSLVIGALAADAHRRRGWQNLAPGDAEWPWPPRG